MGFAVLLLIPYWLLKGLRHGKYLRNLGQRLGLSFPTLVRLPPNRPGAIWIHAVSVGEALSGVPLARERMPFADAIFYFPLDWTFCVRRLLRAVRPSIVIVLETEIWPNFLREARRRSVPVVFVSGRISDRSFARYQRFLGVFGFFLRPFLRHALRDAASFLMQSEKDAERIRALGAPAERVEVNGNLKYDLELPRATPISDWLLKEAG